jgi:hypothetical protein
MLIASVETDMLLLCLKAAADCPRLAFAYTCADGQLVSAALHLLDAQLIYQSSAQRCNAVCQSCNCCKVQLAENLFRVFRLGDSVCLYTAGAIAYVMPVH